MIVAVNANFFPAQKGRSEIFADETLGKQELDNGVAEGFGAGHNIQPDVPPENILAIYDTAFRHGRYPIGCDG